RNGTYEIPDLVSGSYDVTIAGTSIVPHETRSVTVSGTQSLAFSVLVWNAGAAGAVYDDTFHKFFDQVARMAANGQVRKWVMPPTELYLVEGLVPEENFTTVLDVAREINAESVRDMW